MKFLHLGDLHLGKSLGDFDLIKDQKYILEQILGIIKEKSVDGVLIAGDVYDKAVPSEAAMNLLDYFLSSLSKSGVLTFMISGNHDSDDRLNYGSNLFAANQIYIASKYDGTLYRRTVTDAHGEADIYLLPFVKASQVKHFFPDEEIGSYDDAVRLAVKAMNVDTSQRNIILSHQFVTGALRSDSESVSVGGLDDIGADIFADFDYAALGHIHGAQSISREAVRYCGTPLKYSFSEAASPRTLTIAELKEKGSVSVRTEVLEPLHDMREIRGTYMEVTARSFYTDKNRFDYIHCTLTDEQEIPEAMGKLRAVYPNIMKLDYDNLRSKAAEGLPETINISGKSPTELFGEFYERCNNSPMSSEQAEYISGAVAELWGSY